MYVRVYVCFVFISLFHYNLICTSIFLLNVLAMHYSEIIKYKEDITKRNLNVHFILGNTGHA